MDTLLLNFEETLGKEIQHLVALLVKKQVQKELQLLEKTLLPGMNSPIAQQLEKAEVLTDMRLKSTVENIRAEKAAPGKLCTDKLKKLIREMTPERKRRDVTLLIQARMLLKLHEHRNYGIEPTLLFSYSGTGKRAGQRYISFFKEQDCVEFIGAKQNGKYILTDKGIGLIEGSK